MSVNEKVDVEAADYGSIAPEPKNAVAYGKRRTIALGALGVLAFGAAVAFTKTGPPLALANQPFCLPYCPKMTEVCPQPPTGCSYGEAHVDKCGCQTGCPPADCSSKTTTMTNLAFNTDDDFLDAPRGWDDDDDPMDIGVNNDDDDDESA